MGQPLVFLIREIQSQHNNQISEIQEQDTKKVFLDQTVFFFLRQRLELLLRNFLGHSVPSISLLPIFNQCGIIETAMNTILYISLWVVAGLALIVGVLTFIQNLALQKMRKTFFAGKQASDLEEFIIKQNSKLNDLHTRADYIEEAINNLKNMQKLSIQKIGMVRYNPFADDGGNLSFSIALLDEHQNGVVITSMHGRESNRIYAKPIKQGKSEFTLTQEEQQAISSSTNF